MIMAMDVFTLLADLLALKVLSAVLRTALKLAALNTGLLAPCCCLLLAKACLWALASFWAAILCCFSMTDF